MFFSVIIPLYNRPQEIAELLESLTLQTYKDFEVIIVEDGSTVTGEDVVKSYVDRLTVQYFKKGNEGQGIARNYGFARAKGDYFIILDSDVILPKDYFQHVLAGIKAEGWDAFGGPDAAHSSFTTVQKAISYAMTSPFTTGGIRGNKKHVGQFYPRSFNMGLSRTVYEHTGGFRLSRRSEDIEFSIRMINEGFKVGLIPEAYVYHKRRTSLPQFYRQTNSFGKGRIAIYRLYPTELKWVHALPSMFVTGLFVLLFLNAISYFSGACLGFQILTSVGNYLLLLYTLLLFLHALSKTGRLNVAFYAVLAAYTQLIAYGTGFISAYISYKLLKK